LCITHLLLTISLGITPKGPPLQQQYIITY
jgi:hypothetical protein